MPPRHDGKPWWIALLGAIVTSITLMVVLSLTGSGRATEALGVHDGGSVETRSAATQEMIDLHQHMTELMSIDTSPQMMGRMDADPMWASMRNESFTAAMEEEQANIDRMLGRGAP